MLLKRRFGDGLHTEVEMLLLPLLAPGLSSGVFFLESPFCEMVSVRKSLPGPLSIVQLTEMLWGIFFRDWAEDLVES